MGVVFMARDPNIDRQVAVKVLRQDHVESENFVKRFLKEAKVIGRLAHSHIVTIYDVGEEAGNVYIAMELLEGRSLADLIKEKALDIHAVVKLGIQLAETLDYAHLKGVVHRDIKPSNIIVQDGQVKITDFGIAHVEDSTATLQTQAGEMMGTPAYMSPEQVLGQSVDGRSDIFSLGIILYELCAGRRPFGGESKSLMTVFNDIVDNTPEEPLSAMPAAPKGLSRLIMKALQKDPANRFQTGREFAEALSCCLGDTAALPSQPPPPVPAEPARTFLMPVCVGLVLLVVSCGGYYLFSDRGEGGTSPQGKVTAPPGLFAPDPQVRTKGEPAPVNPGKTGQPTTKPKIELVKTDPPKIQSEKPKKLEKHDKPEHKDSVVPSPGPPPVAFLKIETNPVGARVFINGMQRGTTPFNQKIELGLYQIKLTRPGYRDVERQVNMAGKKLYPLWENLTPVE
jgi:eukaryotic-like serine/threonine-protein kinase